MHKLGFACLSLFAGATILFSGCSKDFLEPDPLSFYEPGQTFTTESGLMSVLAFCDRHMKLYYTGLATNAGEVLPMGTEYIFSDLMVAGATDRAKMLCNPCDGLTPTSIGVDDGTGASGKGRLFNSLSTTNSIWHFWHQTYYVIMQANTILQYVDQVETLDDATKNMYKGRAYFHRSFRYLNLVFQWGDVPLITKVTEVPKQNYRSTKRDAILEMITMDMEKAVQWVPDQSSMSEIGMVNKGACRMLLAKCYLALGKYDLAEDQLDILIDQSGYSLIQGSSFGTFNPGAEAQTWPITRNVIWDMHRPENKLIPANKEVILGIVNRGSTDEAMTVMNTMRVFYPFFTQNDPNAPRTRDGQRAVVEIARNAAGYNPLYDYSRGLGRGIATFRPTYFHQHTLWQVNGVMDATDLRHSAESGNWVKMDNIKVNNTASSYYGQPLSIASHDATTGAKLCVDTIRRWFDFPHYKLWLKDEVQEAKLNSTDFRGATTGGIADWYLYRLAEAYLLRAEAKFYQGRANEATADVNMVRDRAKCTQKYVGSVTIGDIMDERARELYMEEWRNVELKRVSLCLARSGMPDEWGHTYSMDNFDKQQGTDKNGGSYWYQRVVNCGKFYNSGPNGDGQINLAIAGGVQNPQYKMDKKNMYWPVYNTSITSNSKGRLWQNYGYDGYDPAIPKWNTWQEAVADEMQTE